MKSQMNNWCFLVLGMLVSVFATAQEPFDVQKGLTPYGSYKGGDIDTVNMMNGNVTLHIPLISLPQRGKSLNLNVNIYNNDKQFIFSYNMVGALVQGQWTLFGGNCPGNFIGCDSGTVNAHVGTYLAGDQGYSTQTLTTYVIGNCVQNPAQSPCTNAVKNFYLMGPDDSRHYLGNYAASLNQTPANCSATAIDYSGYVGVLTGVPGTYTCFGSILDRNGISTSGDIDGNHYANDPNTGNLLDTVGRSIPGIVSIAVSSTPCSSGTVSAQVWNVPGSTQPYYFCSKDLAYSTSFNAHSVNTCLYWSGDQETSGTWRTLTEVILPNGTRYKFSYDSYLSLTQVTLPTGGYISYTWQNVAVNCTSKTSPVSRVLASRAFFDGVSGGGSTYQWVPIVNQGGNVGVTLWDHVVTDQMGNSEVHSIGVGGGSAQDGGVSYYSGCAPVISGCNGRLLKTVSTTYQTTSNPDILNSTAQESMSVNSIPQVKTTVLAGPGPSSSWMTSKTVYTLVPSLAQQTFYVWPADQTQAARPTNVAPNTGQIATVDEYDFGAGAAGAKIRSTTTTYQWQVNSAYLAANLIDLPAKVVVTDGSGNKCSETDYTYDESSRITQFTGATAQFTAQPLTKIRGNATTVSRWVSSTPCQSGATGSFIATHANMYDTGEKYQDIDANSNLRTHTYSSTYYGGYRTQVQMPNTGSIQHSVSAIYDLNTGLITSYTGQNGAPETTSYGWDFNMRRITSAAFPDSGQVTFSYNDTPGSLNVQMSQKQTSTASITKTVTFDGLGRSKQTQLTSDPQGTVYTDTAYDAKGRVASVSNPYRTTASSTDGTTSNEYDGLNRSILIIKQDGSKVQTSYADNCVTVTDEAGKVRKSCSDAFGRLIEVDEPGASGATAGTPGVGTVAIAGGPDQSATFNPCQNNPPPAPNYCPYTLWDSGTIWISGNGFYANTGFAQGTTTAAIASSLASGINTSSSQATATVNGSVITITSKATGAASNFSVGTGTTWQNQTFSQPSFTACLNGATCTSGASSGTLTGGTDSSVGTNPLVTFYKYDSLGNLLCVEQHGTATSGTACSSYPNAFNPANNAYRVRQFFYDSLSRLTKAQNPEAGTITYKYDTDTNCPTPNLFTGLLVSKVDARGVRTCLQYDALNRVVAKTYPNASPFNDHTITYSYDASVSGTNYGIGHRTGMTDASGSSSWTFDKMGRVWGETLTINSLTKTISNLYNLDGSVAQVTYPTGSGSVLAYTYNAAPHLTQVKDTVHNVTYFQSATYYPAGELNQVSYGSTSETEIFNSRMQPCWMYATTGTQLPGTTACSGTATAATTMDLKYGFNFGAGDDGEVMNVTNNKDSNRSVTYTYDALNRIASANSGGTDCSLVSGTSITKNWGETFTIDAWGNLTNRTVTKCSADGLAVTALNSNQLSGFGYDAAGNMTSNGGASYTYDAQSRLKTTAGVTYTYDGDGHRVMKSNGTIYWGLGPALESDLSGNLQREYIFAGGARIARRDISGGAVHYFLADRLGSTSVLVNSTGGIENQYDYLPYGSERDYSVTVTNQNFKFIGKERDSESGLDNFGARFDASSLGRFMTPDWADSPEAIPFAQLINPQSLSQYAYALNSPVTQADLDGHDPGMDHFDNAWAEVADAMAGASHTGAVTGQGANCAPRPSAKKKDQPQNGRTQNNKDTGLRVTPTPDVIDIPGAVKSLLSFFGIEFDSSPVGEMSADVPIEIPIPSKLSWIKDIIEGHGWEDHGKEEFESKEEYKRMILDTVQNAKGGEIVRNPSGRKGVTGFWNDAEGFVVWRDKNNPDQGTAFRPDDPDVYKTKWGFE